MMGRYVVIRPEDDANAQRASEWCDNLMSHSSFAGHKCVEDVDGSSPADQANVSAALGQTAELVLYFGHGDESSWTTSGSATLDTSNVSGAASQKAVVSVACKTSCLLGPAAITGGVTAWLGFTTKVPVTDKHKGADPIGDGLVEALSCLGAGDSMQDAYDAVVAEFDRLTNEFDTGSLSRLYISPLGYFGSMAVRDHCVVNGTASFQPLL
jgi:hypothetical protein